MFPSFATIAIGVTITAALAVVDWYVWRSAPMRQNPRAASETRLAEDKDGAAFKEVA
jgi:hypothetical protein